VVWAVADAPGLAWRQAGIGIVVGEVVIWTQPRRALRDLREYRRRFAGETGAPGRSPSASRTAPALALVPLAAAPLQAGAPAPAAWGAALALRY
jgi:hypothetical protein